MKSLDLVKETIEEVKAQIKVLKSFDGYYADDDDEQKALSNLEIVRQDLEVLELIKNCRFVGYQKFAGNTLIIDNITDEQYQKIKQWLEEQDGD